MPPATCRGQLGATAGERGRWAFEADGAAMNTRRCLSCGDPLGVTTRADCRTCSPCCRQRLSRRRQAERPASAAQRARQAASPRPEGIRTTSRASRDKRGSQS
jgi:hypothetical protein